MKKIKLSIVIPTKNRVTYLQETLMGIIKDLQEGVEIVVVDGGSTDGTNLVMIDFKNQYKFINYIRLTNLKGFDAELDLGVAASRGNYIWIFSDDDIIQGRDINYVMRYLDNNSDVELLLVNSSIWNKELSIKLKSKFVIKPNMSSDNMGLLFENFIDYLSFIGGCIIKKEKWTTNIASQYFGTLFVHVGVIFSHKSLNWHWLDSPLVMIRYGNASWSEKSQLVWLKNWPELIMSLNSVSLESRLRKINFSSITLFKKLIFFKALNVYSSKSLDNIPTIKGIPNLNLIKRILYFIPKNICFYLSYTYAFLLGKATMLYDLRYFKSS